MRCGKKRITTLHTAVNNTTVPTAAVLRLAKLQSPDITVWLVTSLLFKQPRDLSYYLLKVTRVARNQSGNKFYIYYQRTTEGISWRGEREECGWPFSTEGGREKEVSLFRRTRPKLMEASVCLSVKNGRHDAHNWLTAPLSSVHCQFLQEDWACSNYSQFQRGN